VQSDERDGSVFRESSFGYDSAPQAHTSLPSLAVKLDLDPDDCIVIKCFYKDEINEIEE
jgi:hypothetical protein